MHQNEGLRAVFKVELLWVMYRLCGVPIHILNQMVIIRSENGYRFFLDTHSRLVSVAKIFLDSVGPGLKITEYRESCG